MTTKFREALDALAEGRVQFRGDTPKNTYQIEKTIRQALRIAERLESGGDVKLPESKDNAYIMVNLKDWLNNYILIERGKVMIEEVEDEK